MHTVLIVEDNELNRDMLSRRLERKGFRVLMAIDGLQGVELAEASCPDIILMDLSLPVMDGMEALRQLRARPNTKSIPVVALTAHAFVSDRQNALDQGFDEYESKPVNLPQLLRKIDSLLGSPLSR